MQDQDARSRGVVQPRPGQLDLLQLPENILAEVPNDEFVAGFRRVRSKLPVEVSPSEAERSAEGEGAVGQPQVEVEAQGAAFEGLQGVHIERDGMADDLVEERLAQEDLAVP